MLLYCYVQAGARAGEDLLRTDVKWFINFICICPGSSRDGCLFAPAYLQVTEIFAQFFAYIRINIVHRHRFGCMKEISASAFDSNACVTVTFNSRSFHIQQLE